VLAANLRSAIDAVDRVHGYGDDEELMLPDIAIAANRGTRVVGGYEFTRGGESLGIQISTRGEHQAFSLVHEIGHFLDHQILGGGISIGFASANSQLLEAWRQEVRKTSAVKRLAILQRARRGAVDRRAVQEWLRWHEIWARSYAQYVTVRGGESVLTEQLNLLLMAQRQATIRYEPQWERDDFAPVAEAIDRLFLALGWVEEAG
jgi:hypothetical protein